MRRATRRLPAALALACAVASPLAAAETVTFAFAPPTDRAFELRSYGTGTTKWGGNKEVIEVGMISRLRFAPTAGGYRLTDQTQDLAIAMDGKRVESKVLDVVRRNRLTWYVGRDGRLERVEGARENFAAMIPLLEGEAKKRAEQRLAEGEFGGDEIATWFETCEVLAGQTLELDRDYWFRHARSTDDGWVVFDVLFRLGPWEETPHGRRLRQRAAFVSNARAELPQAVELAPKLRSRFDPARPGALARGYKITGNASRLIDPATLLVWREQVYRREEHEIRPVEEVGITFAVEARLDTTLTPVAE